MALRSYDHPQDKEESTWREGRAAAIEHQAALWVAFQLDLAVLKYSAAEDAEASGFEREDGLHIGLVVCRQFWTEPLRHVEHQSIPMGVMTVAS